MLIYLRRAHLPNECRTSVFLLSLVTQKIHFFLFSEKNNQIALMQDLHLFGFSAKSLSRGN